MPLSCLTGIVSRASGLPAFLRGFAHEAGTPRTLAATANWTDEGKVRAGLVGFGDSSSTSSRADRSTAHRSLSFVYLSSPRLPSSRHVSHDAGATHRVTASRRMPRRNIHSGTGAAAAAPEPVGEGVTFKTTAAAERRNGDPACVAFVTGANRGIGLEVTRQLLEKTKGTVIAACRDPSSAADLHTLKGVEGNKDRLDLVQMDIKDQASVESAAEHTKTKHGRVDLLFNVAGILGDGKNTPGPERSLRAMDRDWLRHTLEVNTVGPMMLVAALSPLLESPAKKGDDGAKPPSVVVNFSARVGSIGDNGMGGWHSYRMSKTALNMATKGISLELKRRRVWIFSYHPGTTDTGLSEPFQANVKPEKLFTPTYTVSQMLGIVDSMNEDLSGGFFAFDGKRIIW